MSLRTDILGVRNASDVPLKPVATPEWPQVDGKLFLRQLSAMAVDNYYTKAQSDDTNWRARFVCLVLSDENGNRVLQDDDALALGQKEITVVDRLYWAGREFNGLTEANRSTIQKNSESTGGDGSPSSCCAPSPAAGGSDSTPTDS